MPEGGGEEGSFEEVFAQVLRRRGLEVIWGNGVLERNRGLMRIADLSS